MGHLRRLIVFDLDGTLIDSSQDLADSANALITERGGAPLPVDRIVRMVGEGAATLVRRALGAAGLAWDDRSLPRFLALYDERLLRTTRLYPGIEATVRELAAESVLAVLTNKPEAPSRRILGALGLGPFVQTIVGGDGPFARKPDPASLTHLMTLHGAPPAGTVLVGDSRIDVETARAAGTRMCVARYGFGYDAAAVPVLDSGAEYVDAPAEIPAAVRRLFSGVRP